MDKYARENGVTLTVMVIAVVILLILVSVGVGTLLKDEGAIDRASQAKLEERATKLLEASELWKLENGKLKLEQREPLADALERYKNGGLLKQEEVDTILADENYSITIGGKYIFFKI